MNVDVESDSESSELSIISDNETDRQEEEGEPAAEETESIFDLTLPPTHSYLGEYLLELRGRTLLDDGIYMDLPLILQKSVVLFPGQTLPMTMDNIEVTKMISSCLTKDRTFGIVYQENDKMVPIGTTAEMYQFNMDAGRFRLIAKGRQRFKILRVTKQGRDIALANVQILPERKLGPPFMEDRLTSLDRLRVNVHSEEDAKKQERVENVEAMITAWPSWVYRQYDPMRLSFKIRKQLEYIETRGGNVPKDPTELSYWIAQNVLLDDSEKIILLNYDCAISRLQRVVKNLAQDDKIFVCVRCDSYIGKQSNMIPMSKEGPQAAYCNSLGVIHETVTLYHAQGLSLVNQAPTTAYSWFPGYAWSIAECRKCKIHMGWKFTTTKSNLKPKSFWGLTRKALKYKQM